ncbi:MAG: hypothetical protein LBL07_13000 [Tannerella sp.]|jgi:hypothetical protein|nr:hypothetical protein [Tannerella sp.]
MNTQKRETEDERDSKTGETEIRRACLGMEAGEVKTIQVAYPEFCQMVIRKMGIITGRKYVTSFAGSALTVKRES